ncbi:peptide ABC transporter substrate-binding protein [Cetobacterium somerae]|jgi:oligopeptide transport system substrate-binding protein|uniref:peptide ABC transporter substrate-binding protein n=1 Tax=Cetobacterium somerae TaxID=188913 RepID=UPI003D769876
MLGRLNGKSLAMASLVLLLAACGGKTEEKKEGAPAVETKKNSISYNLGTDPRTIDPQLNTAVDGSIVASNIFEGLYKEDENGKLVPAAAEDVQVSPDGKVYTFKLKENGKWSDGKPVKAQDFVYSWKRGLTPDTAMEYAYMLFYIKNGEKFYNGEVSEDQVGVKALDDKTLEVTLENATPYFLSLTSLPSYYPLREDVVKENSSWAIDPKTYIGNGAFKMKAWNPKENMVLVPNENYWGRSDVKLDELRFDIITDDKTYLNAFKAGEVDIIDSPPSSEIPSLLASGEGKIHPYLGTYFYVVNVSGNNNNPEVVKFLGNPKVRKALALSLNKKQIVDQVTKAGQLPARSFVPEGIVATDGKDFTKDSNYLPPEGNVELAQKLMAEAGYSTPESIPKVTFTFNTGDGHAMVAQAVQDMWKKNLGVDVDLKNEEWAVFQNTRSSKNYDIARHGWIADYNDPMNFLDLWVSNGGNNDAGYSNPEYDNLIKEAQKETDPEKRTALLHKAEDILMNDMPIIPLYYYTSIVVANPKVKGWVKSPLGGYDFKKAYVEN